MLPNILYLVHRLPYPPDKGDRIRTFHFLHYLAQRSNVYLACLADEAVSESSVATLNRLCAKVAIVPVGRWSRWSRACTSLAAGKSATEGLFASRQLRDTILSWAREIAFDVALASSSGMAPFLRLSGLSGVPTIVDLIDVDSEKWFDYAASSSGIKQWLYRLEGNRLRQLERDIAGWARALTLVSRAEADLYLRSCGGGPVHTVGNGVDLDYFQFEPPASRPTCVFVGALDYRPNVDATCWFCREVWPAIRRSRHDAQLNLVGRRPVRAVQRLQEIAGVNVVGQVPDVRPYYREASVVVAPLRIARGIQNKVLEAFAMGRAVVSSPQALEGLEVVPGNEALTASSVDDWSRTVLELLDNAALRRRLGQAGRRFVEKNHHWERCLEPLQRLLGLESTTCAAHSA